MKKIQKIAQLFLAGVLLLGTAACGPGEDSGAAPPADQMVVSRIVEKNGRRLLEVGGQPFFLIGTQIRLDLLQLGGEFGEDMDRYISAAKNLGVTCVQIPVEWRDIEPEKDRYDFSELASIFNILKKHDMKMELLWFSTCMVGDGHSNHIPAYIWEDTAAYPRYDTKYDGMIHGFYGEQGLYKMSEKNLMNREKKVVGKLMEYVYEWEKYNDFPHVLIGVQVYNEADAYPVKRIFEQEAQWKGAQVKAEEAWEDLLLAMDTIGQEFKNAKYSVFTRTNYHPLQGTYDKKNVNGYVDVEYARRTFELEGIDALSIDPYFDDLEKLKQQILLSQSAMPDNYTLIAENSGAYENTDRLLVCSYSLGAAYEIYDLIAPRYATDNALNKGTDYGILYNTDENYLQDKPHTEAARKMIKALASVGHIINSVPLAEFIPFNLHRAEAMEQTQQEICSDKVRYGFYTEHAAIGFALAEEEYITIYCSADSVIELSNGSFSGFEKGRYENGKWLKTGDVVVADGFTAEGNTFYRIHIDSIDGDLENTKLKNIY